MRTLIQKLEHEISREAKKHAQETLEPLRGVFNAMALSRGRTINGETFESYFGKVHEQVKQALVDDEVERLQARLTESTMEVLREPRHSNKKYREKG